MNNAIKKSLDNLAGEIKDSTEYQKYLEARQAWGKAKDAQELFQNYIEARNTTRIFQQGNFPGIEEQQELLKSLYRKVSESKEIEDWSAAQSTYQEFIWEMAEHISETTELPFAPRAKGGCC